MARKIRHCEQIKVRVWQHKVKFCLIYALLVLRVIFDKLFSRLLKRCKF